LPCPFNRNNNRSSSSSSCKNNGSDKSQSQWRCLLPFHMSWSCAMWTLRTKAVNKIKQMSRLICFLLSSSCCRSRWSPICCVGPQRFTFTNSLAPYDNETQAVLAVACPVLGLTRLQYEFMLNLVNAPWFNAEDLPSYRFVPITRGLFIHSDGVDLPACAVHAAWCEAFRHACPRCL
jgi:hypothetical protein